MRKIFGLLAAFVLAAGFTACEDDNVDYNPAKPLEGTQVYFATNAPTAFKVDATSTSVAATVSRSDAEGALEVSISATIDTEYASLFTVAPTALFADGQTTAEVQISFDRSKLVDGASYNITLSVVDEALHTPYAPTTQMFTITVPEPYVLLGTGLIRDDIVTAVFGVENLEWEVEIYENTNVPGYIFLKNAYTSCYPYNEPGDYQTEDHYWGINVSDPTKVLFSKSYMGFDWGYGEFIFGCVAYGTLQNGVITFPKSGLAIGMKEYTEDQYGWYANAKGLFRIVMPGVDLKDYSMTVAYGGMQVEADNTTVSAVLNGTYGADVASMRYAFFDGDVTGAADQASEIIIAAAEEEVGVMAFEQGLDAEDRVFSILESKLAAPGLYTVFCVPYNAAGEPQAGSTAAVSFYFPGMGGQEIPECELVAGLFPFSWVYPDYAADYPDSSTLAAIVAGVDISSCTYGFITGLQLDADVSGQDAMDLRDYVTEALGASSKEDWMYAFDPDMIAYINSEAGLDIYFDELPAETPFTLFVEGTNSYGKSQVYATSRATTAEGVQAEPMSVSKGQATVGKYVLKSRTNLGAALKAHTLKK